MYESLKQHSPGFHLYILAFDDLSYSLLHSVNLEYATIIPLSDFETDELKEVKKDRTLAEYCWTCTPSSISFVMKNFNLSQCTYIDADLYFYSDPSALISEMQENGKSVLITEHRLSTLPKAGRPPWLQGSTGKRPWLWLWRSTSKSRPISKKFPR